MRALICQQWDGVDDLLSVTSRRCASVRPAQDGPTAKRVIEPISESCGE
jgi:hypothetical protein